MSSNKSQSQYHKLSLAYNSTFLDIDDLSQDLSLRHVICGQFKDRIQPKKIYKILASFY